MNKAGSAVTFNVKTRWAEAMWQKLLLMPEGQRHGVTGFWRASLPRVQRMKLVRVADLSTRRFVFEADLDPADTHTMTATRMHEYLSHEAVKRMGEGASTTEDEWKSELRRCLGQGRIVVALRNARAYTAETRNSFKNPVWYS